MAFCHLDDNHGKSWVIIMVKTASKRVRQKIAEATSDLIGKKIVDQITSAGKSKSKKTKQKVRKAKRQKSTYHQKNVNRLQTA